MEYFNRAKAVRLKSNHGKYLFADGDDHTVRQDRNPSSRRAWWAVELVDSDCHVIRLKSFLRPDLYLTATDDAFLLATAGKRVCQLPLPPRKCDAAPAEWEPRADASESGRVRLWTRKGKYLRANAGAPPWRNSVTHDMPRRTKTQNWILWCVEVVDVAVVELTTEEDGRSSSEEDGSDYGSPMSLRSASSGSGLGSRRESAMEMLEKASAVRLRSHHDKYLVADEDEERVEQRRDGSGRSAKWSVERVADGTAVRLKSCFGKYLTASNTPFLLGVTGKKVVQSRLDSSSSVEWEAVREGVQVRLRTRYGQFLRANGGLPPWRNSVTHDVPHRTATQDWVLWDVEVVQLRHASLPRRIMPSPLGRPDNSGSGSESESESESKSSGRKIYYRVSDGTEDDLDDVQEKSFIFNGNTIQELKERLSEETEVDGVAVCSRNLLNGELYPLRLHLPPNNTEMHVVLLLNGPS